MKYFTIGVDAIVVFMMLIWVVYTTVKIFQHRHYYKKNGIPLILVFALFPFVACLELWALTFVSFKSIWLIFRGSMKRR